MRVIVVEQEHGSSAIAIQVHIGRFDFVVVVGRLWLFWRAVQIHLLVVELATLYEMLVGIYRVRRLELLLCAVAELRVGVGGDTAVRVSNVDHLDELTHFEGEKQVDVALQYTRKQLIGEFNSFGH